MAKPIVDQITPNVVQHGDEYKIIGRNLSGNIELYYDSVGPYSIMSSSDTEITVVAPEIDFQSYKLTIVNSDGTSNYLIISVVENLADGFNFCGTTYSEQDYENGSLRLLPRGLAWLAQFGSNLRKLFGGIAVEQKRLETRACDLIKESYPLTATELVLEWEQDLGLPDNCSPNTGGDLESRRLQILRKLSQTGGQNAAYYIELAANLGYKIRIIEFDSTPFLAGHSRAGDAIDNAGIFTWAVRAVDFELIYFRAGQNTAGQPLRQWYNTELECLINELKPAHTIVGFQYIDPEDIDILNENFALPDEVLNENGALPGNTINENVV